MELKSGDLFFIRSFCGKKKIQRGDKRRRTNWEDENVKKGKCWTFYSWVGRIILINSSIIPLLIKSQLWLEVMI